MNSDQSETERVSLLRRAAIGYVGVLLLSIIDPLCGFMVMTPWTGWGFDGWVRAIIISPLLALGVNLPLAISIVRQPSWNRLYFLALAWPVLIAWSVLLPFSALYSLSIVSVHATEGARVFAGVGIIGLLLGAVPAAFLIHTLRHPYWRPIDPPISREAARGSQPVANRLPTGKHQHDAGRRRGGGRGA